MKTLTLALAVIALSACAPARGNLGPAAGALVPSGGDDADAWFLLHDPLVVDDGGDGFWDADEGLTLSLSFTNQRDDHWYYPGVVASTDVTEVAVVGGNENWWYGIAAGETYDVQVRFMPTTALQTGTVVTLMTAASALNCDGEMLPEQEMYCPDPNALLVPVRLGSELP